MRRISLIFIFANVLLIGPFVSYAEVNRKELGVDNQSQAAIESFQSIQDYIRNKDCNAAWQLFYQYTQAIKFDDFKKAVDSNSLVALGFCDLQAKPAFQKDGFVRLTAAHNNKKWIIDIVRENGLWKLKKAEAYTAFWKEKCLPSMQKFTTEHFDIYYFKDSTAEEEIEKIAEQREKGFQKICHFLGIDSNIKICMVLFEDAPQKHNVTGHRGAGWAYEQTIVEVYSTTQKMDPYHEIAHILMGEIGSPPALFDEGFAVYIAKKFSTLKKSTDSKSLFYSQARDLKIKGDWTNLEELMNYTEIGQGNLYTEAGSFIEFLIDNFGRDKFLQTCKTLKRPYSKVTHQKNKEILQSIYGRSLLGLEKMWEAALLKP